MAVTLSLAFVEIVAVLPTLLVETLVHASCVDILQPAKPSSLHAFFQACHSKGCGGQRLSFVHVVSSVGCFGEGIRISAAWNSFVIDIHERRAVKFTPMGA